VTLRLFLDANILFTAAYSSDGLSALLFELRRREILTLLTSAPAIEEAHVNLQLKRPEALDNFTSMLKLVEVIDTPAQSPLQLSLPEDDLLIFTTAIAGRATHFLTGDKKHFGRYFDEPKKTAGIHIQTVRQFFNERFGDDRKKAP
jgi:predicted nucleic acid-binding protein